MRRREFIKGLAGSTVLLPLAARGQQPTKLPRIGVLWHAKNAEQEGTNYKALVKGFANIGYIDGKTVVLEHRFPNEEPAQFRSMAAELVASGVDESPSEPMLLPTQRKQPKQSRSFSL